MTEIKLTLDDPRLELQALEFALGYLETTPLQGATKILAALRDSIEEQVKPAIEEPKEFGSVVRARWSGDPDGDADLWQMSPRHGEHYWQSESTVVDVWSNLTDVEVLRVGIGEEQ